MRNADKTARGQDIRSDGMIPASSQILNNSDVPGYSLNDALEGMYEAVGARNRVKVAGLALETSNEKSAAIGGSGLYQFTPIFAIVQISAIAGAALTGDAHITIGTSAGGTQILASTECTGLIGKNAKFRINLTGLCPAILDNASIYAKVVTVDGTATAGNVVDVYLFGEITDTAA